MFRILKRLALLAAATGIFVALSACDPREAGGPPAERSVEKKAEPQAPAPTQP